mgnify:CR=1 FL=1
MAKSRSQIIMATDTVQLKAQFKDSDGQPADLDSFPTISINQPSGNVALAPTSTGVMRIGDGLYAFNYDVCLNPAFGVYSDIWEGTLNGFPVRGEFNFVVHNTQMPFVNTDGYVSLGDDPGFNYSQTAIRNINLLLKSLRARLDSRGKSKFVDERGVEFYTDCDIFSVEQLVSFLAISLSMFNQIPHFTFFTFEDTDIIAQFHEVLVQGATIYALGSKSLLERGREFNLSDNGVTFTPPTVSDLMSTQWSAELTNHFETVKLIKANLKPFPTGLGTLTVATARHPAIARLRHLRARRFF